MTNSNISTVNCAAVTLLQLRASSRADLSLYARGNEISTQPRSKHVRVDAMWKIRKARLLIVETFEKPHGRLKPYSIELAELFMLFGFSIYILFNVTLIPSKPSLKPVQP